MGAPGTVLVTGGTRRLGRAIAERLAARGWRVLTASHRADAGADFVCDFTDPGAAVRLFAEVQRRLGGRPPEALVNNAAIFSGGDSAIEAINCEAPKKLTTLMACRETGVGSVVNVLDADALSPRGDGESAYLTSKRDLLDSTRRMAALFAATLRVNAVAPGPVMAPEGVHVRAAETPLGRPSADDVADAVAFLIEAPSTTGAVIPVDGGSHLAWG